MRCHCCALEIVGMPVLDNGRYWSQKHWAREKERDARKSLQSRILDFDARHPTRVRWRPARSNIPNRS